MDMLESRIIALEEKFSHQDDLVGKLNIIVANHELIISELIQEIENNRANSGSDSEGLKIEDLKNDVPPHY